MKNLRNHIFIFIALVGITALSAHSAFAVLTPIPTNQIDFSPPTQVGLGNISANDLVRFAINGLVVIGIVASLIFLLYGGLRWVISGGDKAKVDAARGTIVASIVGLIIVILAWVIINAVLTVLTGHGISTFTIPTLNNPNPGATTTP